MSKTSILAVTAVAAMLLAVPAVFSTAAPTIAAQASSTQPGGGSSSGQPSNPGNPGNPGDPGGGSGGDGGDLPVPPPDEQLAQLTETCNAALSSLVKIPVTMVENFGGDVNVVPVCNSGLGHKVPVDNSQAAPLQGAIADNTALSGPLGKDGFKPDDVVGVVLINGVATLYVHTAS